MSTLNDTDLFVVEREGVQYKLEAQYVSTGPTGELEAPVEVLTPLNGAGIGSGVPYNPISSPITLVGEGGVSTCETDPIQSTGQASATAAWDSTDTQGFTNPKNAFDGNSDTYAYWPGGSQDRFLPFKVGTGATKIFISIVNDTDNPHGIYIQSGNNTYTNDAGWDDPTNPGSNTGSNIIAIPPNSKADYIFYLNPGYNQARVYVPASVTAPAGTFGVNNITTDGAADALTDFTTLTFPTTNGFDCFEPGDVVQDPDVKVISKDADAVPPTITVDGGTWTTSDKLVKETPYEASLTCSDDTELANMVGPLTMTDENGDLVTPQTSAIVSVSNPTYTFSAASFTNGQGGSNGSNIVDSNSSSYGSVRQSMPSDLTSNGCFFGSNPTIIAPFKIHVKSHESGPVEVYVNGQATGTIVSNGNFEVDLSGFTLPLTLNKINFVRPSGASNSGPIVEIYGFYIGDQLLSEGVTYSGDPVLTFADNTDLEYFQAGDSWTTAAEQTQPVMYSTTAVPNTPVSGTYFRSNLSKANGGVYGKEIVDTWTVTEAGSLKLAFFNNACAGTGSTSTFNFSSDDGATCSLGSSWDLQTGQKTEVTFTFPSAGSIKITYVIEDLSPFNNNVTYYLDYGSESSISRWSPNSGPAIVLNTNTNLQINEPVTITVISVDPDNSQMVVDGGEWSNGDDISLPTLEASATDVIGVDGNTLQIDGVSGTWKTGLRIKGAEISSSSPSPSSIVFTSSNGGTTAVTGTDATLTSRVWTLEKSSSQTGPWTLVGEYTDFDANASQDGATPWSGKPALEANTFYQVKVKYTSDNADPVESVFNTFKTGDA